VELTSPSTTTACRSNGSHQVSVATPGGTLQSQQAHAQWSHQSQQNRWNSHQSQQNHAQWNSHSPSHQVELSPVPAEPRWNLTSPGTTPVGSHQSQRPQWAALSQQGPRPIASSPGSYINPTARPHPVVLHQSQQYGHIQWVLHQSQAGTSSGSYTSPSSTGTSSGSYTSPSSTGTSSGCPVPVSVDLARI